MSDEKRTIDIEHVASEDNGNFDRSWRDEQWGDRKLSVAAQETAKDEKDLTTWEAIQASKKAIFWCLVISTCVIMEGKRSRSCTRAVADIHRLRHQLARKLLRLS
jgi:hypothetical protein